MLTLRYGTTFWLRKQTYRVNSLSAGGGSYYLRPVSVSRQSVLWVFLQSRNDLSETHVNVGTCSRNAFTIHS